MNTLKRSTTLILLFVLLTACVTGPPPSTRTAEASRTLTVTPVLVTATSTQAPAATATTTAVLTIEPCTQATPPPECWTAGPPLTDTPTAPSTPTRIPPPTSTPVGFVGLTNGSFEGAVYTRPDNTSSLFPVGWEFWWATQDTPFVSTGPVQDNPWLAPEILPKNYQNLGEGRALVPDGDYTLKLFKGWGPIWVVMKQSISLPLGSYDFSCQVFPDMVVSYEGGKQYPTGPDSKWGSEVRTYSSMSAMPDFLLADRVPYGKYTRISTSFNLTQNATIQLILELRGRWGFTNNGWFVDDCQLSRQGSTAPTSTPGATTVGLTSPWMAYHTVDAGDTLGKIAIRYGTTVDNIVSANALRYPTLLTNPSHVEVNWVLNVPCVTCVNNWGCCPATAMP